MQLFVVSQSLYTIHNKPNAKKNFVSLQTTALYVVNRSVAIYVNELDSECRFCAPEAAFFINTILRTVF